jgi:hypothetical protein
MGISANRRMPQQPGLPGSSVAPAAHSLNDIQPFQYPRLQQMAQHNALGGFGRLFGELALRNQEQNRVASGMSPEDWQAKINANLQARRLARPLYG